jgi:D-3-phosphoglycerate dehydrogenase
MSRPKVFAFAPPPWIEAQGESLSASDCELVMGSPSWYMPHGNHEAAICEMATNADAFIGTSLRSNPINKTIMRAAKNLRIIAKVTIGVDDIDIDAATELGILVTHAPTEANWGGVAEGAVCMILDILKKTREKDDQVKQRKWRETNIKGIYLGAREEEGYAGIVIGIVGLGRCGSRVAQLMKPWGVRLLACDPYIEEEKFTHYGVEAVDFATALELSDVITLHTSLTDETHHMVNQAAFKQMKSSAVLINTSRGGVVDEKALVSALQNGDIEAAGIDAFENEPVDPNSGLLDLGYKVLLSPHTVSNNIGSGLGPGIDWANKAVLTAFEGRVPENVYNPAVIPRWRERFEGNSLFADLGSSVDAE